MSTTVVTAPRRRHRGRRALIALLVIVVLLVVAFFVGDYLARKFATSYVRDQVATALDLPSTAPVSVQFGPGSLLLQAATGSINEVVVKVDPLTLDGYTGTATLTAHGVPLSSTTPVRELHVDIDIPEATVAKAIASVPALAAYKPTVTITTQNIAVNATVSILGFPQRVGLTMRPVVTAGVPSFSILTAEFAGATVSVTQLDKYIPGLESTLQAGTSICIANALPKDFVLSSVTLGQHSLVSRFTGNDVELNSASLSMKGTCPGS